MLESRANREKDLVASISVLAAVGLTGMKLVTGLMSGSLGLLSEAAHSGLDLVAALVTLFAVRASSRPADREHNYGHGKIENLSALFETFLLLVTCLWIFHEGIQRLLFKAPRVDATVWAFLAVVISILTDLWRSRALSRAARRHRSQALEADALHFSTDIWSSGVVLVGLILVRVANATGITWLVHADAVAALGVAGIVVLVSVRLGRRAAADLVDTVSPALRDEIMQAVEVEGVDEVRKVRLRRSGAELFVDALLTADRDVSFERAHGIAAAAEAAVRVLHPEADVVVQVDPAPGGREGFLEAIRLVADRLGCRVHGIRIHQGLGGWLAEMDLEVDESLSLEQAHRRATQFETSLRRALPVLKRVIIRLEPVGDESATIPDWEIGDEAVGQALDAIRRELRMNVRPREIMVRRIGERLSASFRCTMGEASSLAAAHLLAAEIERRLRERLPELDRVAIQVEPTSAPIEAGDERAVRQAGRRPIPAPPFRDWRSPSEVSAEI